MYVKFPFTAAFLISLPTPPNTPTCGIIVLFSKISCHVCSLKAGGQLVALPFVVLLNLGIFSFFCGLNGLRTFYLSSQFLMGLTVFLCRVSSGGCPEAGWIASSLLRGWTERRVETFGSALVSYCFNGYQIQQMYVSQPWVRVAEHS